MMKRVFRPSSQPGYDMGGHGGGYRDDRWMPLGEI